ncbi:MAG: Fic family protein [Gemmatimonadota bacterium]|nr:Fic family protein [Gemmatimonadota bacterium]
MTAILSLANLDATRFETPSILKGLAAASRQLAELKGVSTSIPYPGILINALGMQEAKDSSAIENIVTTHDELFRDAAFPDEGGSASAKEVLRYRQALRVGFDAVRASGLLTINHILQIQRELERNEAGFRKVPGTVLKDSVGRTVYTPPDPDVVPGLMSDLERYINAPATADLDPLIRMALIHHQFESIHPFYDGNGRTGRIINVLYLLTQGLLDIPILYMSRYIVRTKSDYYRLLQTVREENAWEAWATYMLRAVEASARDGVAMVTGIKRVLLESKHRIRSEHRKIYSQDLINSLFTHPYTKIQFIERDLDVSRITATKYLNALAAGGILVKRKVGRGYYYINEPLTAILTADSMSS